MNNKPFRYSIGAVDSFVIAANELACSGWILSLEPDPAERLEVAIDGVAIEADTHHPLPSADVHAAWPALAGSAQCRLEIRARLSPQQLAQVVERKGLISVGLTSPGGVPGLPLERPWPISLEKAPSALSDRVGHGDFLETSFSFLSIFRKVAGLGRDEQVLDAGCGLGRMAFGLAHYLGPNARYEGFDISPDLTAMAQARFSSLGNFRFRHVDVYNRMYNGLGQLKASEFVFPYEDGAFSFAFLTSVFTHMFPADVQHYLREIRRVLRPSGRCLATFFVMDEEASESVRQGRSAIPFTHEPDRGCHVHDPAAPENAVAYDEEVLLSMIANAGLKVAARHAGQWAGRTRFLTYQDVLLLEVAQA